MAIRNNVRGLGLLAATCLGVSGPAQARLPDCARTAEPVQLSGKAGRLESLAFDKTGRLLFTDLSAGTLNVLPGPRLPAAVVARVEAPGGIALGEGGDVYVGFGNDLIGGLLPAQGKAGVVRVSLHDGSAHPYAAGLAGSNGLVRTPDGTLYASNAVASYLGRVLPDGTVEPQWLKRSGNGLALSANGQLLYVNQSLPPAKIWQVTLATGAMTSRVQAPLAQGLAFLDGLAAVSTDGSLYATAYLAGQVWRADAQGRLCVLARGLSQPSAVVAGQAGQGFNATSLYVTTHSGSLLELPDVLSPR